MQVLSYSATLPKSKEKNWEKEKSPYLLVAKNVSR